MHIRVIIASLFILSAAAIGHAQVTLPQAVAISRRFCRSIGTPISTTADYQAEKRGAGERHQACWRLTFSDRSSNLSVEVSADDGSICLYRATAVSSASEMKKPAGPPISSTVASKFAAQVIASSGNLDELQPDSIRLIQYTVPATSAGQVWFVSYVRQSGGVPYRRQYANVVLNSE